MNTGCCNECGYKAYYIIDKNNYEDNGYKDLNQVPKDRMLCGACYEENKMTKVKLEIVETFWSEVVIDNVESREQAKEIFYNNVEKFLKQKKYTCDDVEVYDSQFIMEDEDDTA
tara:strand:+ start:1283 stop:1624 length:342 start_codon:yes stop_codon:yes gene_type:complete